MIKWLLFIGLTASLLTGPASSAFAVNMNATGHFYLEQTVSADQFFSTGAAFDLHLNEHTALTTGLGLTPAGLGWLLGGKLFLTRRDSQVSPTPFTRRPRAPGWIPPLAHHRSLWG